MIKTTRIARKNSIKIIVFFYFCFICFLSLFVPITILLVNKTFSLKKEQEYIKTFDASRLNRYYSGKFTLKFTKKNDCELVSTKDFKINPLKINEKQHQIKLFNLGNGQFRDKDDFYTIQIIGKNAFKNNKDIGQHLIIPSVIKKIDDGAFAHTKIETICIKNMKNLLPINESVFDGCKIKKIVTPNIAYKNDPNWKKICKNNKNIVYKPYTLSDYEKFLSLRTFSIALFEFIIVDPKRNMFLKKYNGGTGWIVDKVDHKNDKDYKYWMATNLHVSQIFDRSYNDEVTKSYKDNCRLFCACTCNDIAGSEIHINEPGLGMKEEKKIFHSTKWKQVAIEAKDANKIYNSKTDLDFHKDLIHKHNFTDFSLVKIDFMINQNNDEITKKIKTKLKKINNHLLFNNSLNVYMPNIVEKSTKIYGVGYPMKINNGVFLRDTIKYTFQKGKVIDCFKSNGTHCDLYTVKEWIDNPNDKWLLTHGASGTMMIDENFNTIGIFWGSDGTTKDQTDNIYQDSLMFVDRFYVNENNLVAKFLEI